MPVRIRLARYGHRNHPFYRIYVADSRAPRDGKHLEIVGHYDPKPEIDGNKHLGLKIDRVKYWLSVGAQPSDTVARLLGQAGIIPPPPRKGGGRPGAAPATGRGFAASALTTNL
uniref:Ribosomal protein S16 n=1 Tax=Micromonas pusilla TaxID=38833 RepID=A0A7S0PPZ8_MICPS